MNFLRKLFQDKKNRYNIIAIFFIGVLLIYFSKDLKTVDTKIYESEEEINIETDNFEDDYETKLAQKMENILSKVEGAGEVSVLLTLETSKEIVTKDDYTKESQTSISEDTGKRQDVTKKEETETVKINGDQPLVLKEISPKIAGVLIVAEGGNDIYVKSALINAVKTLLNIDIHKIEVLGMK